MQTGQTVQAKPDGPYQRTRSDGRSDIQETVAETRHERWAHYHVNWTAVWVGSLAAFSMLLLFGLIGISVGAHHLGAENRVVDWKHFGSGNLILSVCGAFFSSVVGGWVAGKVAGILHSEPAMLHGAITWLVTVPMLVVASAIGAVGLFGGWYAGLGVSQNSPSSVNAPFVRPEAPLAIANAADIADYRNDMAAYKQNVDVWREATPKATRNSALGAITALLLGLVGCVIGGWMASGEPMNFSHYKTRTPIYRLA